jgi:hypothetical protein
MLFCYSRNEEPPPTKEKKKEKKKRRGSFEGFFSLHFVLQFVYVWFELLIA